MTALTNTFVLYHTEACHLCELAEAVIQNVSAHYPMSWRKVDIANDDALVEAYGIRIPVLIDMNSREEIGWPFDEQALYDWLTSSTGDAPANS